MEKIISTCVAIIHKEDNLYLVECPEIGTASQRETIEEAVKNLQSISGDYENNSSYQATEHDMRLKS